jgi:hypothetical protein
MGRGAMKEWANFLVAEVGASAALTGLIFVGVSLNLTKILAIRILPDRALEALTLLLSALTFSSLLLVPGQSHVVVGIEVLSLGLLLWLGITALNLRIIRNVADEHRKTTIAMICISQLTVVPYVVAGSLILTLGFVGMYVMVPAILLSIIKANLDAWVLLVEINR